MGSFNKFSISITKPTNLIEFCPGKTIQPRRITKSGFLTLSENCRIQTDKITLRPRINTRINSSYEIELIPDITNFTTNLANELIRNFTTPIRMHSPEPSILIDEHLTDFDNLADEADVLISQFYDQQVMDESYSQRITHNLIIVIGIIMVLFISLTLFGHCLYRKFYNINTWIHLASKFNGPPENVALCKLKSNV